MNSELAKRAHNDATRENASPRPPMQFSLVTMLGLVTLVSVECGLLVNFPVVGSVVALLATIALVRAWAATSVRRELGVPFEPIPTFFVSLGFVCVVALVAFGVGAAATFLFAVSLMVHPAPALFMLIAGIGATIIVPLGLLQLTWPGRKQGASQDDTPWL